jgi:nicotinate-nucleotide adenylyltransferase
MQQRVGIYSGTFDPIHIGHISFAKQAIQECSLDKVIFLPERQPRHKSGVTDIIARAQLIEDHIKDDDTFDVQILTSPAHTYATLTTELTDILERSTIVMLLGSDVLETLPTWTDANTLLRNTELCIGLRNNDSVSTVKKQLSQIEQSLGITIKYWIVSTPHKDTSSSKLRNTNISIKSA